MKKTKEQRQEEKIQDEMSGCVHFTGIQNEVCKAGVNIRQLVGGSDLGWAARLPCLLMDAVNCTTPCDKRHLPTREEAEAEVAKDDIRMAKTLNCMTLAHEDAKSNGFKKGHGGTGSLSCPAGCGGTLQYSVASVNGHMHGRCTTKGCVSWIE